MRIKLHDTEVAEVMSELMEENCPGVVWLSESPAKSHESEHMAKVYETLSALMTEFSALPVTRGTRKVSR